MAAQKIIGKARRVAWRLSYWRGPRYMSTLRKRWQVFRNPNATIRFGAGVQAGPGFTVHAPWGGTLIVGDNVEFRRNCRIDLGPEAVVTIGNDAHLTFDVIITCNTSITIEDGVGLGQNTFVADGNHEYRDLSRSGLDQGYNYRAITIGKDAMVHSKVTVLNNIGERAVIGANAVITKPIPAFTIAAGVPAKLLEYYGPPGQGPDGVPVRSKSPNGEVTPAEQPAPAPDQA